MEIPGCSAKPGSDRKHDLTAIFASCALALGQSLPIIGKLRGHTQVQTTARYALLQRDPHKAPTCRIADRIGDDTRTRVVNAVAG